MHAKRNAERWNEVTADSDFRLPILDYTELIVNRKSKIQNREVLPRATTNN